MNICLSQKLLILCFFSLGKFLVISMIVVAMAHIFISFIFFMSSITGSESFPWTATDVSMSCTSRSSFTSLSRFFNAFNKRATCDSTLSFLRAYAIESYCQSDLIVVS